MLATSIEWDHKTTQTMYDNATGLIESKHSRKSLTFDHKVHYMRYVNGCVVGGGGWKGLYTLPKVAKGELSSWIELVWCDSWPQSDPQKDVAISSKDLATQCKFMEGMRVMNVGNKTHIIQQKWGKLVVINILSFLAFCGSQGAP